MPKCFGFASGCLRQENVPLSANPLPAPPCFCGGNDEARMSCHGKWSNRVYDGKSSRVFCTLWLLTHLQVPEKPCQLRLKMVIVTFTWIWMMVWNTNVPGVKLSLCLSRSLLTHSNSRSFSSIWLFEVALLLSLRIPAHPLL